MTKEELTELTRLIEHPAGDVRPYLRDFVKHAIVTDPDVRTSAQNRALHKWFTEIAELCSDAGIDAKLLMSKTMSVQVNSYIIKGMWKVLQAHLYGTQSTTELEKNKQIDVLVDHFIRFFGEKFELELPPFPSKEEPMTSFAGNTKVPYPPMIHKPTI